MQVFKIILCLLGLSSAFVGKGQNDFSSCTAILLNNKLVVNEYTPEGKCELAVDTKGVFTVQPVSLNENGSCDPQGKRRFKIAIRDGNTKTLFSYADKVYEELDASKVLNQCKKGDYLVFITLDRDLALPHNEVLVK